MKKRLTLGEKWLFVSPFLCLAIAGLVWLWPKNDANSFVVSEAELMSAPQFSPDGRRLLVTFLNARTESWSSRVYDAKSFSEVSNLELPSAMAVKLANQPPIRNYRSFSWSGDGKSIVGNRSGRISVWDAQNGFLKTDFPYSPVKNNWRFEVVRFSPDDKTLVSNGIPPEIFEMETGRRLNQPDTSIPITNRALLSENGRWLAKLDVNSNRFQVSDYHTKRVLWKLAVNENARFVWSDDILCVQSNANFDSPPARNRFLLWNASTRRQLTSPPVAFGVENNHFVFSPDGRTLMYSDGQTRWNERRFTGELVVWDYRAHRKLWRRELSSPIYTPKWSPDGKMLAVSSSTPEGHSDIQVFDLAGKLIYERKTATNASWSPDSKQLAFTLPTRLFLGRPYVNRVEIHRFAD